MSDSLDPQAEDKAYEQAEQEKLDTKLGPLANKPKECFYCDSTFTQAQAIESGVPVDWSQTYCSKRCYEIDIAGMEDDQNDGHK